MTSLLVIIYLAFISLGLPDSLLGSAWPSMYESFGVPLSSAGVVSMIVAAGTIVSSLLSDRLLHRLNTAPLTVISVGMTAVALLGISFAGSFGVLCLWAIPLGLGAGSVDAALNNFVALHYKAKHMNWLHSFWGIGASLGPVILSILLLQTGSWRSGYLVISIIQFALVVILLFSLPLWQKAKSPSADTADTPKPPLGIRKAIKLPKAKVTLAAFFCYCAIESTVGLWGSSYLVVVKGFGEGAAAGWISLFFLGITVGRIVSGFLSQKSSQKHLILLGQLLIGIGILVLILPLPNDLATIGISLIGLGCAPIYPNLLHETPRTFGADKSQAIMGIQMASAYVGTTVMPPLFGLISGFVGFSLFPVYLGVLLLFMASLVWRIYARGALSA